MRIRRVPQLPVARPTLERTYGLMAEAVRFATNDPALMAAADAAFGRFRIPVDDRPPLVVSLFNESLPDASGAVPAAVLPPGATTDLDPGAVRVLDRAHGHVFITSAGPHGIAVTDLDAGVGVGFVSGAMAADARLVRYAFIESMALAMLGRARGYMALHAAGVVRDGHAIVLQGPAGAGKSTLAMACARRGFGVLAEDAVFVRVTASGLELWGLPWVQRLLPDARDHFPELAGAEARLQRNGETKIEVDLDVAYPGRAVPCAAPGPIVLLRRGSGGATRIEADDDAVLEVLWPWDGGWSAGHGRGAALLGEHGVYRLHMNGTPDEAVDALEDVLRR